MPAGQVLALKEQLEAPGGLNKPAAQLVHEDAPLPLYLPCAKRRVCV